MRLFLLLLLLIAQDSVASYLCVADQSTGFQQGRGDNWEATRFDVRDEKFILQKGESSSYIVKRLGDEFDITLSECGEFTKVGSLNCTGLYTFMFSRQTLRFNASYNAGYFFKVNGKTFGDSIYMLIGKCSAI